MKDYNTAREELSGSSPKWYGHSGLLGAMEGGTRDLPGIWRWAALLMTKECHHFYTTE